MTLPILAWLAFAAYAIHILEEFALDWRNWARSVLRLPVDWTTFYITNALVVVLGLVQAEITPTLPLAALAFAALMLTNATFFHVLPLIRGRGRFSPGFGTAMILFYPIGVAEFVVAARTGHLTASMVMESILLGGSLMAYPIVLLKIKDRPYFRQDVGGTSTGS